ncbi:uncharacterized protein FTOL_13288 [Fusarium torulosum]|uniref:Uncharacterized protein n=1 Tax=Fusarium torulosum TaxID=33205 RepID=A0AAE8MNK3_9HYPO|nr:uncharacterized protein FTOL_13288 [Fusarium torulosum]
MLCPWGRRPRINGRPGAHLSVAGEMRLSFTVILKDCLNERTWAARDEGFPTMSVKDSAPGRIV